jgi:hypothetical protein
MKPAPALFQWHDRRELEAERAALISKLRRLKGRRTHDKLRTEGRIAVLTERLLKLETGR